MIVPNFQTSKMFNTPVKYSTIAGSSVFIPSPFEPFQVLGISFDATFEEAKNAQIRLILTEDRQKRAQVSLAYAIIRSLRLEKSLPSHFLNYSSFRKFQYDISSPIVMLYVGDYHGLRSLIQKNRKICDLKCEEECSLLYIATRSGFRDIVQMLLQYGMNVNNFGNGNSPLHIASNYGHACIVSSLISDGAIVRVKNGWGDLPLDMSKNQEIRNILNDADKDEVVNLLRDLQQEKLALKIQNIDYDGNIVGYRVFRNIHERESIASKWSRGWHGTRQKNVISIFRNGLLKPGTKVNGISISECQNHIRRGTKINGIDNWSEAVFVSPTLTYATHNCYADRLSSPGKGEWCIVMDAAIRPGCFTKHDSTVTAYINKERSNSKVEIRVEPGERESSVNTSSNVEIIRISSETNVIVLAALLVKDRFIQNTTLSDNELNNLMYGVDK
jgi:hypothetical protein